LTGEAFDIVESCEEHVRSALHRGERMPEWLPEHLGNCFCAVSFIERVHSTPVVVFSGMPPESFRDRISRSRIQLLVKTQ
jgi:hypothetical protein